MYLKVTISIFVDLCIEYLSNYIFKEEKF
jgi:hypothetical protein